MTLPILLPNKSHSKWAQPTHFQRLFEWNQATSLLSLSPFGERPVPGCVFAINLNNQYRLSSALASTQGPSNPCVYDYMDKDTWACLAEANIPILLDMSLEALFCRKNIADGFMEGAQQHGISLRKLFLVTSNLRASTAFHENFFGALEEAPTILPLDSCLLMLAGFNRRSAVDPDKLSDRLNRVAASRHNSRDHVFISFNGRTRPHRFYILLRMYADGLFAKSAISFLGYDNKTVAQEALLRNFAKAGFPMSSHMTDSLTSFQELIPLEIDVSLESSSRDNAYKTSLPWLSQDPDLYDAAWFSVVIDTVLASRDMLFLTPIAFKSFMNLSPFVYFGNHGALRRMRDLGFRTFGSVIDESYDSIEDDVQRLEAAYQQVLRISRFSEPQLVDAYNQLFDDLVHNYHYFYDYSQAHAQAQLQTRLLNPLHAALEN